MTLRSVQNLVSSCLPNLRLSGVKVLAWATLGCLLNPRGLLTEIARGCVSATSLRHRLKRLGRWLSNRRVQMEEQGQSLLNWLLARQGPLMTPLIAVDWTDEHGMHVLSLSLIWERRAVPFFWYAVKDGELSRSQNSIESAAIGLLQQWMCGRRFILLGDRGFHRTALIRALSVKRGVEFVIRVIKTTHVKVHGHRGALADMSLRTGKVRDFPQALYGQMAAVPVRLVVKRIKLANKKQEHSTWYLVTSIRNESKHRIVEYYSRRMGIEASFRDWKTALGWRHQPHIQVAVRLSRYLLILTMAMLCALVTAERRSGQRKKLLVALPLAWGDEKSASLVQLGIWLVRHLSDRDTSLHIRKTLALWG